MLALSFAGRRPAAGDHCFGRALESFWRRRRMWWGTIRSPFQEAAMKKIEIRKAGPVRLTTSGCHIYPAA